MKYFFLIYFSLIVKVAYSDSLGLPLEGQWQLAAASCFAQENNNFEDLNKAILGNDQLKQYLEIKDKQFTQRAVIALKGSALCTASITGKISKLDRINIEVELEDFYCSDACLTKCDQIVKTMNVFASKRLFYYALKNNMLKLQRKILSDQSIDGQAHACGKGHHEVLLYRKLPRLLGSPKDESALKNTQDKLSSEPSSKLPQKNK